MGWMPSPYGREMGAAIGRLIRLFEGQVPDREVQVGITRIASDYDNWVEAHEYRSLVRGRLLAAEGDQVKGLQYWFAEACLESLYNETHPIDPFDSVAPFWVVPAAIGLAEVVDVPMDSVASALSAN